MKPSAAPLNGIQKHMKVQYHIETLCQVLDTTLEALNVKTKKADLVIKRNIIMMSVRYKFGLSLKETGAVFSRDHSTAIHARAVVRDCFLTHDAKFFHQFEKVRYLFPMKEFLSDNE